MAKTIIIESVKILSWHVDLEVQRVTVHYQFVDDVGTVHGRRKQAIFWKDIPVQYDPEGKVIPTPNDWHQLPIAYQQTLLDLTMDAKAAIETRELV